MKSYEFGHQINTLLHRNIGKPDQSRMRHIVKKDELPEVGVDGYQYPVFCCRATQ